MKKRRHKNKMIKLNDPIKRICVCILILILVSLAIFILIKSSFKIIGRHTKNQNIENLNYIEEDSTEEENENSGITIIVDAGHGGRDPGKIGVNDALEKDINLQIALKLKKHLEDSNYNVIMTREDDRGLYSEGDGNKKATDLQKRVEIINNSDAVLAISIHQNSFTQESSKGAQVFYYTSSEKSERFANIMQEQIKESLQDGNTRQAKANESYYMLKKTRCPIIIVECGFLSNYKEAELLITQDYQEKMAEAICLGLNTYIKEMDASPSNEEQ